MANSYATTNWSSGDDQNILLRKILQRLNLGSATAPLDFSVQRTGLIGTKEARIFKVSGRRLGDFSATDVQQDVGEFLNGQPNYSDMLGTEAMALVSTHAGDAHPLGGGCQTVRITYADLNGNIQVVDYNMAGETPVPVAEKMLCVYSLESVSGNVALGNILLYGDDPETFEQITALQGRSKTCRFMVPNGYTGYLVDWSAVSFSTSLSARLMAKVYTYDRALAPIYINQATMSVGTDEDRTSDLSYLVCPPLSRIKVSVLPGAIDASDGCEVTMTILLVAN